MSALPCLLAQGGHAEWFSALLESGNTKLEPVFTSPAGSSYSHHRSLGFLDLMITGSWLGSGRLSEKYPIEMGKGPVRVCTGCVKRPHSQVKQSLACSLNAGEECKFALNSRRPLYLSKVCVVSGFLAHSLKNVSGSRRIETASHLSQS